MTEAELLKQNLENTIFVLERDIADYTRMLSNVKKELEAVNASMKLLGYQEAA